MGERCIALIEHRAKTAARVMVSEKGSAISFSRRRGMIAVAQDSQDGHEQSRG